MSLKEIVKGMANASEAINHNFKKLDVEIGENEYGKWVKFANGFMVCTATVTPNRSIKTIRQNFKMPKDFLGDVGISVTHASGANEAYQLACGTAMEASEDNEWIVAFTNTTNIGANLPMYLVASGFAKEE